MKGSLTLSVMFLVMILVVSCGGGEQTQRQAESPTAGATDTAAPSIERPSGEDDAVAVGRTTVTPIPTPAPVRGANVGLPLLVDAMELVLTQGDVPSGFILVKQETLSLRDAAREWANPDEWLKNYERWGLVQFAKVEFNKGVLEENINSNVEVYGSIDGARKSFDQQRKEGKEELKKDAEASGAKILALEQSEGPPLGDDNSVLFHVRASVQVLGTPASLDFVGVIFRTGNVVASIGWSSLDKNILRDDVVQLGLKQDRLLRAAQIQDIQTQLESAALEECGELARVELAPSLDRIPVKFRWDQAPGTTRYIIMIFGVEPLEETIFMCSHSYETTLPLVVGAQYQSGLKAEIFVIPNAGKALLTRSLREGAHNRFNEFQVTSGMEPVFFPRASYYVPDWGLKEVDGRLRFIVMPGLCTSTELVNDPTHWMGALKADLNEWWGFQDKPTGDAEDEIIEFSYSQNGWNLEYNPEDTLRGVANASTNLAQIYRAYPNSKFVVIAHSLGGVVALDAINRFPWMRDRTHAVVTVSSPLAGITDVRGWLRSQVSSLSGCGEGGIWANVANPTWQDLDADSPIIQSIADEDNQLSFANELDLVVPWERSFTPGSSEHTWICASVGLGRSPGSNHSALLEDPAHRFTILLWSAGWAKRGAIPNSYTCSSTPATPSPAPTPALIATPTPVPTLGPNAITILTPKNNAALNTTTPTFRWNAPPPSANVIEYEIKVFRYPRHPSVTRAPGATPVPGTTIRIRTKQTQVTLSEPLPAGDGYEYVWTVFGVNEQGNLEPSTYSGPIQFLVSADATSPPTAQRKVILMAGLCSSTAKLREPDHWMTALTADLQNNWGYQGDDIIEFSYSPNGWNVGYNVEDTLKGVGNAATNIGHIYRAFPDSQFDIIAHSLGGVVALDAMNRFPLLREQTRRIVTVNSPLRGTSEVQEWLGAPWATALGCGEWGGWANLQNPTWLDLDDDSPVITAIRDEPWDDFTVISFANDRDRIVLRDRSFLPEKGISWCSPGDAERSLQYNHSMLLTDPSARANLLATALPDTLTPHQCQ